MIRYANVWDDADILCEALAPVGKGGRILSIASAGDNVLSLLTLDPKEVVAADINCTQLMCLELKMAAFLEFNHEKLLAFLGVKPSKTRVEDYHLLLRRRLSLSAVNFWDAHKEDIALGVIFAGRLERYIRLINQYLLPSIHSKKVRESLLKERTHLERIEFYDNTWNTFLWRWLFKLAFNKYFLNWMGRDPVFYDHVYDTISERILARTRHALIELPTNNNPYLAYVIHGNYTMEALPRYLRPEFKDEITDRLERITLVCAPIHQTGKGNFDGFNLSDVFEGMEEGEFENCYQTLLMQAHPQARIVYWNLLVARDVPDQFLDYVKPIVDLSEVLHWRDKAWFYQAFHVDEVIKMM